MISEKPWSTQAVVRLCLGVFATLSGGMCVAGLLEAAKSGLSPDQLQFVQMLILIATFQGAALIWVGVFLDQSNISWSEAFGLRPRWRARVIAAGLVVGIVVVPAMWLMQSFSESAMKFLHLTPEAQVAVKELQNSALPTAELIVFGVFTIVLAPIAEEVLFRGILYPTIKQAGHPRWALWGTATLFGIMHFNMASLVPLIFLAVLLVYLYEFSNSLLAPIATHAIFNAANFFYLVLGDQIDHLLHRLHVS